MTLFPLAVQLPDELMVALAGLIGAVAYWIRRQVSKKPSVEEQFRAIVLHQLKRDAKHNEATVEFQEKALSLLIDQSRMMKDMFRLIRDNPCSWKGGGTPPQWQQQVQAVLTKFELLLERHSQRGGGGPRR